MKKFNVLLPLMLLFLFVQVAFSEIMNDSTPKPYTIGLNVKDTLGTGNGWAILNGTDSATLETNWSPQSGWAYFIYYKPLTKTADSIRVFLRLIAKDYNKNVLYYTVVDTFRVAGGTLALPIGSPTVGFYYDLKAYTTCENSTDSVYVNFMGIGRRK